MIQYCKKVIERGKHLASICASPAHVLTPHGLLEGHKATCYPTMQDKLVDRSESHKRVVVSGKIGNPSIIRLICLNLVTSQGPGTSVEFSLEIIN